jgi:hypothetical protein
MIKQGPKSLTRAIHTVMCAKYFHSMPLWALLGREHENADRGRQRVNPSDRRLQLDHTAFGPELKDSFSSEIGK